MPRKINGVLSKIIDKTFERIKFMNSLNNQRKRPFYSLKDALRKTKAKGLIPIIAEFKRASPRGIINLNLDPKEASLKMIKGGASAISVLTEPYFFKGSFEDLSIIAKTVKAPVLMKDFIISKKQIKKAYTLGADAILLITKILRTDELKEFLKLSKSLSLEAIIEIHDFEDLEKALKIKPSIIGINNRDLRSLKVDLNTFKELAPSIPKNIIKVAESGVNNLKDVLKLIEFGADAILIGTSIMRAKDIEKTLSKFVNPY